LRGGDLDVSILTSARRSSGCASTDARTTDVVLGFDTCDEYLRTALHGMRRRTVRQRIAGGRFLADGVAHQLSRNENDNHLHGGFEGFSRKVCRSMR